MQGRYARSFYSIGTAKLQDKIDVTENQFDTFSADSSSGWGNELITDSDMDAVSESRQFPQVINASELVVSDVEESVGVRNECLGDSDEDESDNLCVGRAC